MIPRIPPVRQVPAWQQALARAITDPRELLQILGLSPDWLPEARAAARAFPLRVPRGFAARMRKGDPADPLLRQVLPLEAELEPAPGYHRDPVGDLQAMTEPGLIQKYAGRALLITTGACAVHCRYCFRRHFPYSDAHIGAGQWEPILAHLRAQPDVREIILSGGDPLVLSTRRLHELTTRLEAISQVRRLRIHTRLPVVLPERVDEPLLEWIRALGLQTVVVIHANHARELDGAVASALSRLRDAGASLLNQAVLLRGINDDLDSQEALCERLFALGTLPYYLHMLDPVQGAAHFAVEAERARALVHGLEARMPGYLVPRLVREEPGAAAKTPLTTA